MLETCQKHHMFLGLGLLVAVTIVVLVIESRLAPEPSHHGRNQHIVIENNSTCWMHEKYSVIEECHPCTDVDIVTPSLGVCIHTHYKEILRCQSGEIVTKSCDRVALIDQRNFIKFEVLCFVVGLLSYFVSYARDRVLSRRTHMKIEMQLNRAH